MASSLPEQPEAKRRRQAVTADDAELFAYIDAHQAEYVERLAEFVAIQGVSMDPQRRPDVVRAVEWAKAWCERLGSTAKLEELGEQTLLDGSKLPLPPVLLAQFGSDPSKRTLVVYGHLDVQPARRSDGWDTEPFKLTEVCGALYGRGASDDKGPVCAWLWAIEAHQKLGRELPVNLRCIFEGMEESGSLGLPDLVRRLGAPGGYLDPAACGFLCVSDNSWIGKGRPCLTHGLRGNVYFHLEVTCSSKDLHSGDFGGSVHEAMTDCVRLMASLVDSSGKILVDGMYRDVVPVDESVRAAFREMDFDLEAYKQDAGVSQVHGQLLHPTKEEVLLHRWNWPTLSLHGIEGAFGEAGSKTVIPARVVGKFSIRIVPHMTPLQVEALVRKHLEHEWARLQSPNKMTLTVSKASMHWYRDPNDPNFRAAAAATGRVHGVLPCYTRNGGSIPIVEVLEEVCAATCVLLPIGASDDGAHSQNEKMDRAHYLNGIKVMSCYMDEVAKLPPQLDAAAMAASAESEASRLAAGKWRRQCKKSLFRYGCECLECQLPGDA